MGKTFGLFACATVVAASVWWASSQQTTQAVLAQTEPGSTAAGPPGFGGPPSAGDEQLKAAQRARINDMMRKAVQMERQGNRNAAIRFAASADALVRSSGVELNPQAESPAQFIARLQGRPAPANTATRQPAASPGNPFAGLSQPAPTRPAPTLPGSNTPTKQQAVELLREARRAFEAGDLLGARRMALEAKQMTATWGLFEENPDQLLADIERKTNTTTIAPADGPSPFPVEDAIAQSVEGNPFAPQNSKPQTAEGNPFTPKNAQPNAKPEANPFETSPVPAITPKAPVGNPFATAGQPKSQPQPAAPSQNDINKAKANQLMAAAKKDADAGQFDAARQKLKAAESLDVVYSVHDERPELVLEDIELLEAKTRNVAQQRPAVPTPPQPNAQELAKRDKAQQLLKEARNAIRAGQFSVAETKLNEARQLKAPYQQFDDTPESVAALLKQLQQPAVEPKPTFPDFPEPSTPVADADPSGPSFPPAPEPSDTEKTSDAPFPSFPPVPKAEPKAEPNQGNPFAAAPQAQPETPGTFDIAKKAPAPPKTEGGVVHPSGPSATELFDRGLKHFNDGKYEEAYDAFLHCYRTGQRMDPYRTQSLQDMLQSLRPLIAQRKAANIQQVKNEEPGERRFGPGTEKDFNAQGGIDLVKKEQQVKYEKLRSETLNAIFQADRLRDAEKPSEALELIDRTLANVSDADLTEQQLKPLVRQLKVARTEIEAWQQQRAPILELKERNRIVKEQIEKERTNTVRVEQELANMVEEFNELFKQRRYAEAEVVSKKAKELAPENPVTEMMFWKARFARRDARNQELKLAKEEGFIEALHSVEESAIPFDDSKPFRFPDPKKWEELTQRRSKYGTDNRIKTEKEQQIEKSLTRPISLHFTETPLNDVIKHIATAAGINVVVDNLGLSEEGILPDQPVSIDVDGIKLESALNLMLEPLHLSYMIQDEVLKITSRIRQQGELEVVTYPVADLVVAIPNFKPSGGTGLQSSGLEHNAWSGPANFSVPAGGSLQPVAGAQYQVNDGIGGAGNMSNPWSAPGLESSLGGGGSSVDFDTLSDLIITTIEPDTWAEAGGSGSVRSYETTLSLVIRQTQKVHEEIRDLLEQLRRLQDLQVTIEVRFITVADRFFERIGIDFDFNVQDNVEGDDVNLTPPAFGTNLGGPSFGNLQGNQQGQRGQQGQQGQGVVGVAGIGGGPGAMNALIMGVPSQIAGGQVGGQVGGQAGGQVGGQVGGAAGGAAGQFLTPPSLLNLPALDDWPKNGTVVGLSSPGVFTPDLDVQFQQGSFDLGVPDFGNFNPDAGIQVGMAILTDIEAFFFIQAAQADERTNIMFAPKVTLFNGQQATVQSTTQRPFVTSLIPTVGFFSVGFTPQITVLSEGVTLQVQAVISADRRFVRLTVVPNFTNITDVFTFSFTGGGGGGGQVGGGGQANQGVAGGFGGGGLGQGQVGQGGGFGGGGFGGGQVGGGQFGFGGIGGGPNAMNALALGLPNQIGGFGGGQVGGQVGQGGFGGGQVGGQVGGNVGGQGGGFGGGAVGQTTIQQPVFEVVNVTTTVSVPDGGTVLLGGIKRLREGRNMAGVPILNKIPYISRLFKNTGVGRETESLMLMVTPRIIIQEEEEELLGIF